jgi:threonine dehydrogenase-like Zn-dependent dehydrogenase
MVSGLGGIGAATIAVARARGASVISLQRREDGVVLAKELGADHVVVADGPSAAQAVGREGMVIDGFIEATGAAEVASAAIDIVRPGGTVVIFGVYGQPARLDLNQIAEFKELDVRGGHLAPHGAFGEAIDLLADGSVPGERLITHRYSLDDAESAFAPPPPDELRVRAVLEPSAGWRPEPSAAAGEGAPLGRTAEPSS